MAFSINDGWDVAHHHIHEAFGHIAHAYAINVGVSQKFKNIETLAWQKCLEASAEVAQNAIIEHKLSIKAVVLFQAGIEAWISWAYTDPSMASLSPPNHFVPKWETALNHFKNTFSFSPYAKFYREIRNPVVHPSQSSDIDKIKDIWVKPVYEGMKSGWQAMSSLSSNLNKPFDSNSWDVMCLANGFASNHDINATFKLYEIEQRLLKKHLEGFRNNE